MTIKTAMTGEKLPFFKNKCERTNTKELVVNFLRSTLDLIFLSLESKTPVIKRIRVRMV